MCNLHHKCDFGSFKPASNNLATVTDNESNFNNENNLLLIDVEPALAKGTQIKGKVTLIEVWLILKTFFSGNVDNLFDYKNIENDGVDYDERSTINSSLDSGTLSSKSSGKLDLDFFLENFTTLFITLPCWNVNPKTQKMLDWKSKPTYLCKRNPKLRLLCGIGLF